jgi:pyrimidine operon attenuation protein / uracil phosphoribosyltransferase
MQEILNQIQIDQKITRLAHQIIEHTFEVKNLFIGGICGNGNLLANKLAEIINQHSEQTVKTFDIQINKKTPWSEAVTFDIDEDELQNQYILLVDDVLNSGKTMQYALKKVLDIPTKTIKTVVLVDRKHRRYPVQANFVGLTLSTTLQERVEFKFETNKSVAYLI